MHTYQILFFVGSGVALVAGIIGAWIEDTIKHKREVANLKRIIRRQDSFIAKYISGGDNNVHP